MVSSIKEVMDEIFDRVIYVADERDLFLNAYDNFYDDVLMLEDEILNEPVRVEVSKEGIPSVTTFLQYVEDLKTRVLRDIDDYKKHKLYSTFRIVDFLEKERAIPIDARLYFWYLRGNGIPNGRRN